MSDTKNTPENQPDAAENDFQKDPMWKRRVGVLWIHRGNRGNYLSGEISLEKITGKKETVKVNILQNNAKTMEKHPDYEIFLQRVGTTQNILEKPEVKEKKGELL